MYFDYNGIRPTVEELKTFEPDCIAFQEWLIWWPFELSATASMYLYGHEDLYIYALGLVRELGGQRFQLAQTLQNRTFPLEVWPCETKSSWCRYWGKSADLSHSLRFRTSIKRFRPEYDILNYLKIEICWYRRKNGRSQWVFQYNTLGALMAGLLWWEHDDWGARNIFVGDWYTGLLMGVDCSWW